ncbi:hypothetical protein Hbl1158_06400 [Halobaculum sp. CBA1158]|uniref:GLUG motif-containing protein n=1 Tax=Halobaculum sp. CBA1158 TaxID=2904243 RepID=UPI001F2FE03F|nr:GLUG motif-containing protein [Halobaculum sp. CBA1158]UIP00984.1 hypothetical protein Hbl1158_06400 [Halobaculum sp. CBA1158]
MGSLAVYGEEDVTRVENVVQHIAIANIVIDGATITRVALVDVDIDGGDNTGGLVGFGDGVIAEGSVSGDVTGANKTGGLVGRNYADISNSSVTANVTSQFNTGGIVGYCPQA